MRGAQQPPYYLQLTIRADTLFRLLQCNALHADELWCQNAASKRQLMALLLESVRQELKGD